MANSIIFTLFKSRFPAVFLAAMLLLTGGLYAQAQAQSWIQVESKNNILETRQRAQFFAREHPDTRAFSTKSGWYAIVIGPMSRPEAQAQLARLKQQNSIPQDSFVSDGSTFLTQLWPLVANTRIEPAVAPQSAATTAEGTDTGGNARDSGPKDGETPIAAASGATDTGADTGTDTGTDTAPAPAPVPVATGPIPDPDIRATRKAERGWSRDEKKQYQTYMVWTGDYGAAIDGAYGPGTRKAIRKFQSREGYQATGFLTADQVMLLKQRYDDKIALIGLETLRNLDAGIEIEYPANLVKFDRFEPPFVRYGPKDGGKVRMILISQKGGRGMLNSLYDIMETLDFIPPGGYRVKRRDWFVLSGHGDKIVSYTYAKTANGMVKGFSLIWPPEMDSIMKPLATAMYNSFTPLDDYVLDETLGSGQTPTPPVDLTSGLDTPEPTRAATGFIINADGVLLTNASNITGCKRITFADGISLKQVAQDAVTGLVALQPDSAYTPKSFVLFSDEVAKLGTAITIAGFSYPAVMESATLNYGTITDTSGPAGDPAAMRVSAFLEAGDVGGPVLDDRGAVLAMDMARPDSQSDLPEYVNFALKSAQITDFLDRNQISYGTSRAIDPVAPEDLAFMAGNFTVKVACWDK